MFGIALGLSLALQSLTLNGILPGAQMQRVPGADEVVATLNGKPILASEVNKVLWDWVGYPMTQQVIGMMMVEEAAKDAGVSVSDEEVRKAVDEQLTQYKANIPEGRTFEQHLRAMGIPYSQVWVQVRQSMLFERIAMKDFKPEALRKLAHIVIKPKDFSDRARQDAMNKANEIIAWAKGGETWASLVEQHSEDIATKPLNGSLGWVGPHVLPEDIMAAAASAQTGAIIGPFVTSDGIVVIKVENAGPPPENELEAAKNAYLQRAQMLLQQKLRDEYKHENKLVPAIKNNGGQ